jgi:hypothetical protein
MTPVARRGTRSRPHPAKSWLGHRVSLDLTLISGMIHRPPGPSFRFTDPAGHPPDAGDEHRADQLPVWRLVERFAMTDDPAPLKQIEGIFGDDCTPAWWTDKRANAISSGKRSSLAYHAAGRPAPCSPTQAAGRSRTPSR